MENRHGLCIDVLITDATQAEYQAARQAKTQMAAFLSGVAYNLLRIAKLNEAKATSWRRPVRKGQQLSEGE